MIFECKDPEGEWIRDMKERMAERYEVYTVVPEEELTLTATCGSPEALGVALVTLAQDAKEADQQAPSVAVWDRVEGRWIVSPHGGEELP